RRRNARCSALSTDADIERCAELVRGRMYGCIHRKNRNPANKTKGEAMNRSIRKVVFVVVFSSFVLNLITSRQINSGLNIDIGVTTAQASGSNAAQSLSYNMPYTVQNPNCQQSNNSELSDF